ncbi:MAG: DNA polymerase I, partial [Patescibacteria group bacterium]
MASKNPSKTLVIVDGNALVHRAFHALPATLTSPSGQMTNAVYGFATIFLKMYRELKPDYVAVTFDRAAKTFRHDTYTEYKATRVKQPDELYEQFPLIKELVATFNVPIYELDGYEADDVIGTICKTTDGGVKKIIVTGDMDALQLIDDHTAVYTLKKGIGETVIYDAAAVEEKYGLTPKQIIDYKALRGDASDNIPGVRGIGEKTATELLQTFGTLDAVLKAAKKKDPKIKERIRLLLTEYEADARLSEELATIVTDAPIDFELDDARVQPINRQAVFKLFQELGFKSLLNRLPDNSPAVPTKTQGSLLGAAPDQATPTDDETSVVALRDGYHLITTAAAATKLAEEIAHQDTIALDTETTGLDPLSDRLLGLGLGWANGVAYYVTAPAISAELKKILADPKIKKVGHNLKFDIKVLATAGLAVNGVWFDTMVAAYLLNPGSRAHDLDTMAFTELGYEMTPIESLIGPKGKGQVTLADVALDRVADYCCEDVDYTWRLYAKLADELERQNMLGLMEKIETPLIPVLATMELTGVNIDGDFLDELDGDLENRRQKIDQQIYKLADKKFNIDSPLQLKEVLFDDLKISTAGLKKVKTGISTAAAELEKLAGRHPIIELISEHRELAKLQSTYTQALPKLVHPRTGRVHTSFNQTVTATGRLSSSDPNLQNIPIRTELGREIRKAFVADKGNVIVAADYSQIELRIVASLASDQHMIE